MTQECGTCHAVSADGAKFCAECGAGLARVCSVCGHRSAGGKFCPECGASLDGPAATVAGDLDGRAAVSAPVSELRTTTVLFGDLVAFTTLAEQRDPEDVRELLSDYFSIARTVVGRYGGTIEKFIGDAVMAVWGVPVGHEDDAERAVRAGLDLVSEVAALGVRIEEPDLALRVGITTGSVAVTLGAVNEGMVAGDAVNTAARIQTAAGPGTVWTDRETRELTAAAIAFDDMGDHTLKGKDEPVRLFRVESVVAAVGGARRVDGVEAPLTGRDPQMRLVKELFHATEGDGRPRLLIVSGVPGIGKSRLGWEFEKYVDGLTNTTWWHRGRSLSYGEGVGFWAFSEMVRSRLGLVDGDDPAQHRAAIRDGVRTLVTDAVEADWLTPRIEALLGVWDGPTFERANLFAAWTTFLDRVGSQDGAQEPVVLLFEDMQYADPSLLDLLDHVLETTRAKLLAIVLTRPDLLEARPTLAASQRATVVELDPLAEPAMGLLVDGLVDDLPAQARRAIVNRCDGVPLYAVETVRSLVDADAVVARDGRHVYIDHDQSLVDLAQLSAPRSLQTLIAARLDALTAVERRAVQDASVLGLVFRRAGLLALSRAALGDVDLALAGLVRKGVVSELDDARSPEGGQYRFLQAMVREVAYATLARKDRQARHLAAADHLETTGDAELTGVIGQHLLDALAVSAAGEDQHDLRARARTRLVDAAERTLAVGSYAEAVRAAQAALELDPEPVTRARLLELTGRAYFGSGSNHRAEELVEQAAAAFAVSGGVTDVVRTLALQAKLVNIQGQSQESRELADRAVDLARARPGDVQAADLVAAYHATLNATRAVGDLDANWQAVLAVISMAEELGDPALLVQSLRMLSQSMFDAGGATAQVVLMDGAVALARQHHLLDQLGLMAVSLGTHAYRQDLPRALEQFDEALVTLPRTGDVFSYEIALVNVGFAWWLAGEWNRLEAEAEAWLTDRDTTVLNAAVSVSAMQVRLARGRKITRRDAPDSQDPWEQLTVVLMRALPEVARGAAERVCASVAAATEAAFGPQAVLEDFEVLWALSVEIQLAAGDVEAAQRLLPLADRMLGNHAAALARGQIPRIRGLVALAAGADPEVDLREAITHLDAYGAPYLAARSRLELGRWLLRRGRPDEARPMLAHAREAFVVLGALPSIETVDAVTRGSTSPPTPPHADVRTT